MNGDGIPIIFAGSALGSLECSETHGIPQTEITDIHMYIVQCIIVGELHPAVANVLGAN